MQCRDKYYAMELVDPFPTNMTFYTVHGQAHTCAEMMLYKLTLAGDLVSSGPGYLGSFSGDKKLFTPATPISLHGIGEVEDVAWPGLGVWPTI